MVWPTFPVHLDGCFKFYFNSPIDNRLLMQSPRQIEAIYIIPPSTLTTTPISLGESNLPVTLLLLIICYK